MGCLLSCFKRFRGQTLLVEASEEPKTYSWDKRDRSNVQDFVIDGKKAEMVVKHAGTVNGEQIVIQNCQDSVIYVFDHIATVSVDDCINCTIFLGPIKSSVFIRDCKHCRVMVACQQFRSRDCFQIETFLLCSTQPIIESSSHMKFACFRYFYQQLEHQFHLAGLSIFNNNWSNIHDFTPVPDEDSNFSYLPLETKVEDRMRVPDGEEFLAMQIRVDPESSLVPQTWGKRGALSYESSLVVLFHDAGVRERAIQFIREVRSRNPHSVLVQTKEISMGPDDVQRVFGSNTNANAARQGPIIGVQFSGEGIVPLCQALVGEIMKDNPAVAFASQSAEAAVAQIEGFYNFADMQMGI